MHYAIPDDLIAPRAEVDASDLDDFEFIESKEQNETPDDINGDDGKCRYCSSVFFIR